MGARYHRVLVPTDFSEWARASVERCPEIPGVSEVVLLHVVNPREISGFTGNGDGNGAGYGRIERELKRDGRFLEEQGLNVTCRIEPSRGPDIARTILQAADESGAALIMAGARGAGRLRETLLGSVSHDILRNAKCDVIIMYPRSRSHGPAGEPSVCPLLFSSIFCPVDLSRVSEETIRDTHELDSRSRFILFHAVSRAGSLPEFNLARSRAMDRLQNLQKEIERRGGHASVLVKMGDPVLLSVAEAERDNASLILLSRYGRFDYMKNIPIGRTAEAIALRSGRPVLVRNIKIALNVVVRELTSEQFCLAEQVWMHYHQQKADPHTDRIFAVFVEDEIAGVARCRRHPDGIEVDGVFVTEEFRDRGYARRLMQELVRECGHETLFMHATLELVSFYSTFGFEPVPEIDLPPTIRERFGFAQGNMAGSDVCPMRRNPDHNAS